MEKQAVRLKHHSVNRRSNRYLQRLPQNLQYRVLACRRAVETRKGEMVVCCLLELSTRDKEVGMLRKEHKIRVLTVLYRNSQIDHPQLVSSTTIAEQLNMNLPELQKMLRSMEGMGVIETDPDLRFNLITREGLVWLDHQSPHGLSSFD